MDLPPPIGGLPPPPPSQLPPPSQTFSHPPDLPARAPSPLSTSFPAHHGNPGPPPPAPKSPKQIRRGPSPSHPQKNSSADFPPPPPSLPHGFENPQLSTITTNFHSPMSHSVGTLPSPSDFSQVPAPNPLPPSKSPKRGPPPPHLPSNSSSPAPLPPSLPSSQSNPSLLQHMEQNSNSPLPPSIPSYNPAPPLSLPKPHPPSLNMPPNPNATPGGAPPLPPSLPVSDTNLPADPNAPPPLPNLPLSMPKTPPPPSFLPSAPSSDLEGRGVSPLPPNLVLSARPSSNLSSAHPTSSLCTARPAPPSPLSSNPNPPPPPLSFPPDPNPAARKIDLPLPSPSRAPKPAGPPLPPPPPPIEDDPPGAIPKPLLAFHLDTSTTSSLADSETTNSFDDHSESDRKEEEKEEEDGVQDREKMGRLRHKAAMEILTSEETYLTSLMLVRELFQKPFEDVCEETGSKLMLTRVELGMFFGPLDIIIGYSKALYTQLRASISPVADGESLCLSSVFTSFVAFLKVYKQYTDNYEVTTQELYQRTSERPQLKKFIDEAQLKPESKGLSLFDFLIMPVQRVPRYCLLLREVIKFTPETHEDSLALKDALSSIQNLAGEINESKRVMEQKINFLKVQGRLGLPSGWPLAPHRVYVTETNAAVVDLPHEGFHCTLILFNDILLVCCQLGRQTAAITLSRSFELKGAEAELCVVSELPTEALTPVRLSGTRSKIQSTKRPKSMGMKGLSLKSRSSTRDSSSLTDGNEFGIRLTFPHEQSIVVLFESESEKDKFSEHFEKSCQYCASRRPRILDSDSLDYKAKEEFTKTGNKKFKGNVHSKSFFGNDFVDWIVESESCDRLKASQIGQTFLETGVLLACEPKKCHNEFQDKGFPYRFAWDSREKQILILKDLGKKSQNKVTVHLAGFKDSPTFIRARRTLNQLKSEDSDRITIWSSEFGDADSYNDWLCEKRQALGAVVVSARYHNADHIFWVTFERTEYFLGNYTEMLLVFNEVPAFQGDTIKMALRAQTQHIWF